MRACIFQRSTAGSWVVLLAMASIIGCSTAPLRQAPTQIPDSAYLANGFKPVLGGGSVPSEGLRDGGIISRLERRHGRPLQVLQISGGGQNGAFGAGLLNAWSARGTRPQFDIVTGVSTGALISTFAFLGTPADDRALAEVFTGVGPADIYSEGGVVGILFGADSLLQPDALRKLLAKHITAQTLQRVARAGEEGRVLIVGTTNLDRDESWVWDMTEIAQRGALDLYLDVLMASAAPPVAFPPVEIGGFLFADGSTRSNLVVVGLGGGELQDSVRAGQGTRGTMYVIHNGRLHANKRPAQRDIKSIVGNSLQANLDGQMAVELFRAYLVAGVRGYDFRLASIPENVTIGQNMLAFNRAEMNAVYAAGRALASGPQPWGDEPPELDDVGPWARKVPAMLRQGLGLPPIAQ